MPPGCPGKVTERERGSLTWESEVCGYWSFLPRARAWAVQHSCLCGTSMVGTLRGQCLVGTSSAPTLCLEMTQSSLPPTHPVPSFFPFFFFFLCVSSFYFLSSYCLHMLWLSRPVHPKEILPPPDTTWWLQASCQYSFTVDMLFDQLPSSKQPC